MTPQMETGNAGHEGPESHDQPDARAESSANRRAITLRVSVTPAMPRMRSGRRPQVSTSRSRTGEDQVDEPRGDLILEGAADLEAAFSRIVGA